MALNRYEFSTISGRNLPSNWQSQSSMDELEVFLQSNWEQRSVFYNDEELNSKQQFLEFLPHQRIKTKRYIGTIVFKGEQLNIFPRVFKTEKEDYETDDLSKEHLMHNLVKWVEYCNKFNYPFLNISSELSDVDDLRELFIVLYINYVRSAIERGLYYCYTEETEDRSSIKGKFDVADYITRKIPNGQSDRFRCTYSNFEFDNSVNRIIKYTCRLLYNSTNKKNQKVLRKILTRLEEVSLIPCNPSDCDGIRLSKMHRNYEIIISMSKMFLINKLSNCSIDSHDSFCFLFPTNLLFEGFIGGFMKDVLNEFGGTVKLQESTGKVFEKIVFKGQDIKPGFSMRHDILAEFNNKVFILDTKYKELSRFEESSNVNTVLNQDVDISDVYQVVTYAIKRKIDDVYLIYPMYRDEEAESEFPIAVCPVENKSVNVHFIRIPFVFDDDEKTSYQLTNVIKDIFDIKN